MSWWGIPSSKLQAVYSVKLMDFQFAENMRVFLGDVREFGRFCMCIIKPGHGRDEDMAKMPVTTTPEPDPARSAPAVRLPDELEAQGLLSPGYRYRKEGHGTPDLMGQIVDLRHQEW